MRRDACDEYAAALTSLGVPEPVAAIWADSDRGIAAGWLAADSGDLRRLIGRPTTTLAEAVATASASLARAPR